MIGLRALVLNKSYLPISLFPLRASTIPVEDAVTRICNETCHVVFDYGRRIKTQHLDMNWPAVIARNDIGNISLQVRLNRESLYYRDHAICAYCGKSLRPEEMTIDHVIPRYHGGKHVWENVVSSCQDCNNAKAHNLPKGRWLPNVKLFRPDFWTMVARRRKFPITVGHESWIQFLGNWEAEIFVKGY